MEHFNTCGESPGANAITNDKPTKYPDSTVLVLGYCLPCSFGPSPYKNAEKRNVGASGAQKGGPAHAGGLALPRGPTREAMTCEGKLRSSPVMEKLFILNHERAAWPLPSGYVL